MIRSYAAALLTVLLAATQPAGAQDPMAGRETIATNHDFDTMWDRLEAAIEDNQMLLLYRASASRGAATRGIEIPGNAVYGVYRNDFAVRMLEASVPAGIEAPLIFYLTERPDAGTDLTWRRPSHVFGAYGNVELDQLGADLDPIFASIAEQATAE